MPTSIGNFLEKEFWTPPPYPQHPPSINFCPKLQKCTILKKLRQVLPKTPKTHYLKKKLRKCLPKTPKKQYIKKLEFFWIGGIRVFEPTKNPGVSRLNIFFQRGQSRGPPSHPQLGGPFWPPRLAHLKKVFCLLPPGFLVVSDLSYCNSQA